MSFGEKILQYQEDILRDLAELVKVPSVRSEAGEGMPFGEQSALALKTALRQAEKLGLAVKNVDNYAGHAEYGEGDEYAAVLAHVDVVPAGGDWESDPFTMVIRDGCCYGRGTADDKGEAVAALYCLKVLKDEKVPMKRKIRVILGAAEETGSEDMQYYFSKEPLPVMGFTPDAEYGVCNREKGMLHIKISGRHSPVVRRFDAGVVYNAVPARAEAELCCSEEQFARLQETAESSQGEFYFEKTSEGGNIVSLGVASHAMQPQEGRNAASMLLCLLGKVFTEEELGGLLSFAHSRIGMEYSGDAAGVACEDEESGPLTLNLGMVKSGGEEAFIGIDIRYPVTEDGERLVSVLRSAAEEAGLSCVVESHSKPLYLPAESPFIRLLKGAYQEITGEEAELYSTGGGTYARSLKGRGVAFGPFFSDEPDRRLHNCGEHIEIERFMVHAQICLEAMYRMATTD